MSIRTTKNGFRIDSEMHYPEEYLDRLKALIGLIANQDKDLADQYDIFQAAQLLLDMLPDEGQVRKMLEEPQ